jgi:hypothetical protein
MMAIIGGPSRDQTGRILLFRNPLGWSSDCPRIELSRLTMKEPLYLRTVKKCLAIFDYNISMSAQNLW